MGLKKPWAEVAKIGGKMLTSRTRHLLHPKIRFPRYGVRDENSLPRYMELGGRKPLRGERDERWYNADGRILRVQKPVFQV